MISKSYLVENDVEFFRKNNFILFYGENFGLKKDFKKKIENIYKKSHISNLDQDQILKDKNILINELSNLSLFADEKVIFIDNATDKIFEILKEITELKTRNKVFLFSDILDKKSKLRNLFEKTNNLQIIACYADNNISLRKIILEKLKGFQNLSAENINLILEKSNTDRVKIHNELDKIIIFFQDKILNTKKLEYLLDANINEDFNILKEEAFLGNKINTNRLLSDTSLENEKSVYYISLINHRLFKLKEIKNISTNSNYESIINSMKPPIFWKDKPNIISQLKKWNLNKIKKISDKSYNIEVMMKSNIAISKNVLLKNLIVQICDQANA